MLESVCLAGWLAFIFIFVSFSVFLLGLVSPFLPFFKNFMWHPFDFLKLFVFFASISESLRTLSTLTGLVTYIHARTHCYSMNDVFQLPVSYFPFFFVAISLKFVNLLFFPHFSFHGVSNCSLLFHCPSIQLSCISRTCINRGFFHLHCLRILCKDRLRLRVSYIHCIAFFRQHVQLSTRIFPVLLTSSPQHPRTCLLAVYDVKLGGDWLNHCTTLMPKCCFRMILVFFSHCPHFPPCAFAMQMGLSDAARPIFSHHLRFTPFSCW